MYFEFYPLQRLFIRPLSKHAQGRKYFKKLGRWQASIKAEEMRIMDKMKASILAFEFCLSQKINYLITRFNRLDEILTHGREIGTPYENSIMRDAFVGLRNYLLKELLSLQHYLSKVLTWEFYQSLDFRNSFMCN